ncbi:hypothetical protein F5882DRAFT_237087, partial [Hyaloscypha sp. PMI_1271]
LKSLYFDEIEIRRHGIEKPLEETCKWLFGQPHYLTWMRRERLGEHKGILWIKGKPGSGKSTLMKHIMHVLKDGNVSPAIVSFFFDARATQLENTALGFYRSMLHQALEQTIRWPVEAVKMFADKFKWTTSPVWHQQEFRKALEIALLSFGRAQHSCYILIDALDECQDTDQTPGTESWQEIVTFLNRVSQLAVKEGTNLNICVSRRHFPNIRAQPLEITTESFNSKDIERYIEKNLSPSFKKNSEVHRELIDRAGGVFLWVLLTIIELNRAAVDGATVSEILEIIRSEIPQSLSDTFKHSLSKIPARNRKQTRLLLQWVLFAMKPLSARELQYAVTFEAKRDSQKDSESAPNFVELSQIENRVRMLSGGLVESRVTNEHREQRIQFIHGSVREYLLQ